MPIVTIVDTSSGPAAFSGPVAFKVALPSTQTQYVDTSLSLIFSPSGTAATPITLAIMGQNPDAFVATLKTQLVSGGRPGGTFPPTEVSTGPGGSPVNTVLQPERDEKFSYSFEITFTAPSTAPQSLAGILVVTWLDGGQTQTQSVTLTGTVSEITQAIKFVGGENNQGGSMTYGVTIGYTSLDPSILHVEITNPTPKPSVTINTVSTSLPPSFGKPEKILQPFRTKTINVLVSIGQSPGREVSTQIQVSSPDFPLLLLPPLPIKFAVVLPG
jgi:hypothetical protein